jgi:hypothetical protein
VSLPADPPLWSAAQQSWLQAMGYTVFVDGNVEAAVPDPGIELGVAAVAAATPPAPARERAAQAPRSVESDAPAAPPRGEPAPARRTAPANSDDPIAAAPRERAAGGRRAAVRMPDRLQIALLRASGCNPAAAETQALMASWNLDALRADPAAKRALWPQLRALRKRGQA